MPFTLLRRRIPLLLLGCALGACTSTPAPTALPSLPFTPETRTSAPASASSTPTAVSLYLPLVGSEETAVPPPTAEIAAAASPTPQPSPTPDWPPALDRLTNSKISIHTLGPFDSYILESIRRGKPRLVKSVGDFGWLTEVKAVSPEIVTIGRILAEQNEWIGTVDPVVAGKAYVDLNVEAYRLNTGVDYWEGWNEFVPVDAARMKWFAQFEATRACEMQARGYRAVVGGFSVGVPEYALMADFLPALEAARRCGGLFHLHEYNAPTLDCLVATNTPNIIPGAPALSVPAGPYTLRYRFWYEGYLKPRGWGDLPLVISELGIDGVSRSACNSPGGEGWKVYSDWWTRNGVGPDGAQAYVNTLAWYDSELRKDDYVLGATIFTAGAQAPGGWHPFDIHDVFIPLTKYLVSQ